MSLKIKEGAIFLADAHYHKNKRDEFLYFLKNIHQKKIKIPQLFLVGDIFDLLVFQIKNSIEENTQVITLLKEISKETEIFYFEGNHDFNLKKIFPFKVFKREEQPVKFLYGTKKIYIMHGDKFENNIFYEYYCKIIRNSFFLSFLNFLNKKINIYSRIQNYNLGKKLCKKKINLYKREAIAKKYSFLIEGHYHQGVIKQNYINLPAFGCSKRILKIKNNNFLFQTHC